MKIRAKKWNIGRVVVLALAVCATLVGTTPIAAQAASARSIAPTSQPASKQGSHGRYRVDGGYLSGSLTPLASADQFRAVGVHFLIDPSTVSQSIAAPQFFALQGVQTGDGWIYSHEASPNVGSGILRIGVAFNDITHTELLAAGQPTARALKSVHTIGSAHEISQGSATSPRRAASQPSSCPTSPQRSGVSPNLCYSLTRYVTQETWWTDPIGIQVTWVATQLVCQEYYLPSEVICSIDDAVDYDQQSAWYQVSHSKYLNYYSSQTVAEADTYAHFGNSQFPLCNGYVVDNYYSPNWARDTASDSYSGGASTWVSSQSSCQNLLSPNYYTAIG